MMPKEELDSKLDSFIYSFDSIINSHDYLKVECLFSDMSKFVVNADACDCFNDKSDKLTLKRVDKLQDLSIEISCIFEKKLASDYKKKHLNLDGYLKDVSSVVEEEIKCTNINEKSNVLFMGAGSFPVSAIKLVRSTGCKVICYDIDNEAINSSQKVLCQESQFENYSFRCEDISKLDFSNITHIVIASLVKDKSMVLENLQKYVSEDTYVIIRYGNGIKSVFNGQFNSFDESLWQETKLMPKENKLCDISVLKKIN